MAYHQQPSLAPFVERLASHSVLSQRERSDLLNLPIRVRHVRPNDDFVALGHPADHACCVLEGLVGRFEQNVRGDRQITALHIRGDVPDLHSVVQPNASSALQALSASTILEIPHAALRRASREHPTIAEAFWRDCTVDSMILAQWVVNLGRRDARSRIAHLLCEMACRYGAAPAAGTVTFELRMTQSQMADAAGLTTVHVNRSLKALVTTGTTFQHGRVRIGDWDALVQIGDFDPNYLQSESHPEQRMRLVH